MKQTRIGLSALLLCAAVTLSACASAPAEQAAETAQTAASAGQTELSVTTDALSSKFDETFSSRDLSGTYDASGAVRIALNGASAACDSGSVTVSGSTVTITAAGTYLLSGTLDDGSIIIDAGKEDKVQLVLEGASITSKAFAAIYVKQADKVFLTLAEGSVNTLSNGGAFEAIDENSVDGVIFSKDDLTLNGTGTLKIASSAKHGVVCKDDLVITGGTYEITAASHALCAKDSISIADGALTLTAGKDGIHADNDEDAQQGNIYIANGTVTMDAGDDGIFASGALQIDGGTFAITSGGGAKGSASTENTSLKGLKADGNLLLNGGAFTIDAADDGIHSNSDISVVAGTYTISSGDDGIHADGTVSITGGAVNILTSKEGIEGLSINISDGLVSLVSSDDGLNATNGGSAGGQLRWRGGFDAATSATPSVTGSLSPVAATDDLTSHADSTPSIVISGGEIHVSAEGDGIDSNGSLLISGGTVYVSGPTRSGNGVLDYDGAGVITGGILIGTGPTGMGQNQNFGTSSTQGAIMVTVGSQEAGSVITLTDESGKELLRWTAEKAYGCVNISCPEIVQGGTYTLNAGTYTETITMDSLIYGQGGMGGRGGQGRTFDASGGLDGNRIPGERTYPGGTDENGTAPEWGGRGGKGGRRGAGLEQQTVPDPTEPAQTMQTF